MCHKRVGCAGFQQHCCHIIPPLLPRLQKENEKGDLPILLDFLCLHAPQVHPSLPAHNNRPCHHQPHSGVSLHQKLSVNHSRAGKQQFPKGGVGMYHLFHKQLTCGSPAPLLPEEAPYKAQGLQDWYLTAVQGECYRILLAFPQQQPDTSLPCCSL